MKAEGPPAAQEAHRGSAAGGLAPLRGLRLALALAWIALVSAIYLAARELGRALVP